MEKKAPAGHLFALQRRLAPLARTAGPTHTLTLQQLARLAGGLNPALQVGSGVEAGNRA